MYTPQSRSTTRSFDFLTMSISTLVTSSVVTGRTGKSVRSAAMRCMSTMSEWGSPKCSFVAKLSVSTSTTISSIHCSFVSLRMSMGTPTVEPPFVLSSTAASSASEALTSKDLPSLSWTPPPPLFGEAASCQRETANRASLSSLHVFLFFFFFVCIALFFFLPPRPRRWPRRPGSSAPACCRGPMRGGT